MSFGPAVPGLMPATSTDGGGEGGGGGGGGGVDAPAPPVGDSGPVVTPSGTSIPLVAFIAIGVLALAAMAYAKGKL